MSVADLLGSDISSAEDDEESFAGSPAEKRSAESENDPGSNHASMKEEVGRSERTESVTAKDLFGESASSSESEPDKAATPAPPAAITSQPDDVFRDFEDDEPEEPVRPPSPTRINIAMPRLDAQLPPEVYFVKLPNFLSVEPRPFDSGTYMDEVEDDEMLDEEGRTRLKLKVENTIRWRSVRDENGDEVKESNARIVRWSDGSMSLLLGNEVFDIHKQQLMSNDHSHLYLRHGSGLMAQTIFKNKLTFRPHSTDSVTHRKMTLSMADKFNKTQKIRVLPVAGLDPERRINEMAKQAEVNMRNSMKLENRKKRMREKAASRGLTSRLLEPDQEDDEMESLSAIKNLHRREGALKQTREEEMADFLASDEEDDEGAEEGSEDEDAEQMERLRRAKEDSQTDERRRSESPRKIGKKRKPVSKRIIESDEEDMED